ncbi:MAG TPA: methyltransferase domain-containing protein [Methylomirabilota bacterium]|jgi:SAM-dependent methyltransferase|nr:methyltransferase domain-containing protein [Methylomirabilota bacterium]
MKVNFGCGRFPLPGWINVDRDPAVKCDVYHDLNVVPYPFDSGAASEILASHVLEHLDDPFATMAEFARLIRPGGHITVRVPHFSRGFTHPDHRRGFDVSFPLYFRPAFAGGFCGTELECVRLRFRWLGQPALKREELGRARYAVARVLGWWFDWWANLAPAVCSRLWCFWVGGFEEVEFVFRRPGR